MIQFKGKPFAGENNANRTIAIQLPHIVATFPEVQGCHSGTINIEMEAPLIVARPDHRTPPIKWKASLQDGEVFDLVRILLEAPLGGPAHKAWLYVAHRSAHRKNLCRHEVIAPFINLAGVEEYRLSIEHPCKYLAYKQNSVYVVGPAKSVFIPSPNLV